MRRAEILAIVANHPAYGLIRYEPVRGFDGRTAYRLTGRRLLAMAPSTAKTAEFTINFWKEKGWIKT